MRIRHASSIHLYRAALTPVGGATLFAVGAIAAGCATGGISTSRPPAVAVATSREPIPAIAKTEDDATPKVPKSAFHPWAGREDMVSLEGNGATPYLRGGVGLSHLIGDRIAHDPSLLKGIASPTAEDGTFLGEFPNNAWLSVKNFVGRGEVELSLLHWEKEHWRATQKTLDLRAIALWRGGSVLGLVGYPRAQLKVIGGPGAPGLKGIDPSICATSLAALESGEIMVIGNGCDDAHQEETFAQRWSATGVRSKPESLGNMGDMASIVLRGANEAYVHTVEFPSITSWDGNAWTPIEVPEGTKVPSLDVSKQGTLWIAGTKLYRKPKGQSWEEVALPSTEGVELNLAQVWAKDDADVWVVTLDGSSVVLRNRPAVEVARLPDNVGLWRAQRDLQPVTAAKRTCNTGGGAVSGFFVSLGAVPGTAADLEATMSAMKDDKAYDGVRFVETRFRGERQVGAEVDDFEQGKRLTALLKSTLPTATPRFVCHVFVVTRDLSGDPITGENDKTARAVTKD